MLNYFSYFTGLPILILVNYFMVDIYAICMFWHILACNLFYQYFDVIFPKS